RSEANPLSMIVILGLLAIAFSTQLLPLTVDMLYLQRGTRQGAIAGLIGGVLTIFLLSPFFPMLAGNTLGDLLSSMRGMIDTGAWGLVVNVTLFVVVTFLTRGADNGRLSPAEHDG
ncbi:MAG: hypothetical protein VYB08_02080, partial [Candidatus Latescibacterota bacterium]|nr:hypothetical protein [Candidatus Latescibacterota bacterium]